jgi:ATP-dependent DNA helicase RecQ
MQDFLQLLQTYYGYRSFRPHQSEIIETIVRGTSCLVLMPTGGGKSVCYQIPALAMEGTALVISPLISLMKDQVESLRSNGVQAEFINSSLTRDREQRVKNEVLNGNVKLLYLSPEKATATEISFFRQMKVSLLAIDEAHCISQWGHDFRPEYRQLKRLLEHIGPVPVIALTATADNTTRKDILKQFGMEQAPVFVSSFDRPNIRLGVISGLKKRAKMEALTEFVRVRGDVPGIVYCQSRKLTEEVSAWLRQNGINSSYYHAGMESAERTQVQDAFIHDRVQVICATVAFGMGIDKSNVRWVVHFNLPAKMENYYQELGRGGRDGAPAEALLFYNTSDLNLLRKFAMESAQKELNLEKLRQMESYAHAKICRRKILLNYFGEHLSGNCGNCDICSHPTPLTDGTAHAKTALTAVSQTGEKVGMSLLILLLRGSHAHQVIESGYDQLSSHGSGEKISVEEWQFLILQFLQLGLVELAYDDHFHLKITRQGHAVLNDQHQVLIAPMEHAKRRLREHHSEIDSNFQTDDELMRQLKRLRRSLADEMALPPFLVCSDVTLQAMLLRKPSSLQELSLIPGMSVRKLELYGLRFLQILHPGFKISTESSFQIPSGTIPAFVKEMKSRRLMITASTISRVCLGRITKYDDPGMAELSFFGIYLGKIKHNDLVELVNGELMKEEYIHPADYFFNDEVYNHLTQPAIKSIEETIRKLPVIRPTESITNDFILSLRHEFPRSYEPWNEPEITLLKSAINQTNDLSLLAQLFERHPNTIKTFYKNVFLRNEKIPY